MGELLGKLLWLQKRGEGTRLDGGASGGEGEREGSRLWQKTSCPQGAQVTLWGPVEAMLSPGRPLGPAAHTPPSHMPPLPPPKPGQQDPPCRLLRKDGGGTWRATPHQKQVLSQRHPNAARGRLHPGEERRTHGGPAGAWGNLSLLPPPSQAPRTGHSGLARKPPCKGLVSPRHSQEDSSKDDGWEQCLALTFLFPEASLPCSLSHQCPQTPGPFLAFPAVLTTECGTGL